MAANNLFEWSKNSSAFLTKLAKNKDQFGKKSQLFNLAAVCGDLFVVWNEQDKTLLAVDVREKSSGDVFYELRLSFPPTFQVFNVTASVTDQVALWGPRGAVVVHVDSSIAGSLSRKQLCRAYGVDEHHYTCHYAVNICRVLWHPDSVQDKMRLAVLSNDNVISMYDGPAYVAAIFKITISPSGAAENTLSPSSAFSRQIQVQLGLTAVDFTFAAKTQTADGTAVRQAFVLMGSGDIYAVKLPAVQTDVLPVDGPLPVQPPSEDNYGTDGYSILCVSEGVVPILAIAANDGNIYHTVALPSEIKGGSTMLYIFEKITLNVSLDSADQVDDDMQQCPIRLFKDPTAPQRYICYHTSGLHMIALPFVDALERFASEGSSDDAGFYLRGERSIVEDVLCTMALLRSRPTPVIGACVLPRANHPATLLVLTAAWEILTLSHTLTYHLDMQRNLLLTELDKSTSSSSSIEGVDLEAQLRALLAGSRVPQLAQGNADYTPDQCIDILRRTVFKFREEWLSKLKLCKSQIEACISLNREMKRDQMDSLVALEKDAETLTKEYNALARKFDTAQSRQKELVDRMDAVLHKLQCKSPVLSTAELRMAAELHDFEQRLPHLKVMLEQARAKNEYKARGKLKKDFPPEGASTTNLSAVQTQQIQTALEDNSQIIADLISKLNHVKRDLETVGDLT